MPAVSVIVPARDAAATLPEALAALAAQDPVRPHEVIVVDDGSTDDTPRIAAEYGAVVVAGGGRGPANARNLGAAIATGDVFAFTDADCVPEPGWIAGVTAAIARADLVQGRVLPPDGVPIGRFDRHITVLSEYGLYETANLAVRRSLFEGLGGFESILTPRRGIELGEDVWFGWRARRAGASTVFAPEATVRHAVFPRRAGGYVGERLRLRFFPELAARIPELRDGFLHRRVFLNARSARFDLALGGLAIAAAARSPLPLVAVLPYSWTAVAAVWGRPRAAETLLVHAAADAVGAAALVYGSLRSRSAVL